MLYSMFLKGADVGSCACDKSHKGKARWLCWFPCLCQVAWCGKLVVLVLLECVCQVVQPTVHRERGPREATQGAI